MRGTKRLFSIVLIALAAGAATQSWSWWSWANSPVAVAAEGKDDFQQVQISEGTGSNQIGQDLEAAGLIRSTTAWKLMNKWRSFRGKAGGFQAGSYLISPSQSMEEIADTIWDGRTVQVSFTIPEGWHREKMAAYLEKEGLTTAEEFLAATENIPYDRFPWLPDGIPHLEGFLYPDTYQIGSDVVSAESLVDVMLRQFEQVALPIYDSQPSNYSFLEWVTLSSIVEEESVVDDERDLIASVFARRLEEGMPLGSDPTVEYGLGIEQTKEQPLTWAQVETPNPYNTYMNPGLTPTPISSPGAESLASSLNPAPTEYLYFVARYDGTHVFSETLGDHESAQGKIRDRVDAEVAESRRKKSKPSRNDS